MCWLLKMELSKVSRLRMEHLTQMSSQKLMFLLLVLRLLNGY